MHPRIHSDPAIMMGKPVIKGTRITVQHILLVLTSGASFNEIIENYPHLVEEDIIAALEYAAVEVGRRKVSIEKIAAE